VSEEGVTLFSCREQNNKTEHICCTERTIQSAMGLSQFCHWWSVVSTALC